MVSGDGNSAFPVEEHGVDRRVTGPGQREPRPVAEGEHFAVRQRSV